MENQRTSQPATQGARLQDLTRSVQEIEARVSGVGDTLTELNEQAMQFIADRPVAAMGVAFGVGFVIGKLASRRWLV